MKKRCSGYKGHWECGDDYPDHMVPREKFNKRPHHDGLQAACKKCHRYGAAAVRLKNNDKVVDITPRFKSEYGPSKPMTKRESTVVDGERIPQGWVYIVMNPDVPWILKIGKTYPDGISQIITSARRFGRAELVDKFWFEDALQAEKDVHAMLSEYNLRNLDYQDCGMELFKCTYKEAKDAITKIQSRYDKPSIAVGK
jgi:hypothetical protein